jgi:uncharacterized protein YjiS (DUF1127 family)
MRLLHANAQDSPMSEMASYSPPFAASETADKRLFAGIGRRLLDTLHAWRIRTRQRSELMMLNSVELQELSVTEADVNRETGRPFWESIDINGRCLKHDGMSAVGQKRTNHHGRKSIVVRRCPIADIRRCIKQKDRLAAVSPKSDQVF